MTPSACVSLAVKIAVGRRSPASIRCARSRASYRPWAPWPIHSAGIEMPAPASSRVRPSSRSRLDVKPNGSATASPMNPIAVWPRSSRCRAASAPPAASSPMTRGIAAIDGVWTSMNTTGTGTAAERGDRPVGRRQRHHDQPVGALRLGQRAEVVVALLDRLDVVDDEVELAVGQNGVDAAEPLCRLRPGQERDDDADGQRPTEAQPPRRRARREAELLHHGQDPVAGLGVDDVLPVQRPRGGRDADPGVARDVADGDRLLRHGTSRMKPVT